MRGPRPALLAVAASSLLSPVVPVALERPSPSAEELWRTYPLRENVAEPARPAPVATEARRVSAAGSDSSGGSLVPPAIAGLVLAIGAGALAWTFRPLGPGRGAMLKRNAAEPAGAKPPGEPAAAKPVAPDADASTVPAPEPVAPSAVPPKAATPKPLPPPDAVKQRPAAKQVARAPRANMSLLAGGRRPGPAAPTRPAAPNRAAPPDPRRGWSAEIEWVQSKATSRFTVVARTEGEADSTVIAESRRLAWPPDTPKKVQALADAVAALERSLVGAGWTALSPGKGWYAKRFAWQPAAGAAPAAPPLAPVDASQPPEDEQEHAGRFLRRSAWPPDSDGFWRCELRWDAGVVNSRFEAIVYEPHSRRGVPVAESATFKWLMMGDPQRDADEYRSELRRLVDALEAAGWERVGRGAKWYSARFLWRRAGAPPDRTDPTPTATRQAP